MRKPKDYGNKPAFSQAGKMPCRSWSLQALETCPGSKNWDQAARKLVLVDACIGCYATEGNYRFPNVKAPRVHNQDDWKRDEWVYDMVESINLNDKYFRWFDSGDMYDLRLANKILEVMKLTPMTYHWLPTRMHKFPKFKKVIDQMNRLFNVIVRLSSDSIQGETIPGEYTSTIIQHDENSPYIPNLCEAYKNEGKCGSCRKCWHKDQQVIVYPQHGRKMAKHNKELIKIVDVTEWIPTREVV